ncbi:MAG: HAMP domain-containing sensor histidine kinase [Prolixibacteraceae bacterium]|nr:HAMP domain-containing sensor histidine kinase [Prolixibacteraceae bacterium]
MEEGFLKRIIISFLTNQNRIQRNNPDFWKALLINLMLSAMVCVFLLFAIVDITLFDMKVESLINSFAFIITLSVLYFFHRTDNIRISALTVVGVLSIVILLIVFRLSPNYQIFIWTGILPPFAFFLLGKRGGYIISFLFGAALAAYYVTVYNDWEHQLFGLEGVFNVSLAYMALVIAIGFYEASRKEAFDYMLEDIEKRKKAELLLKSNEAHLYEINATKDKFMSIIAHDLRSPFSTILGFSSIIQEQMQEQKHENIHEFASLIHTTSEQVMDLLSNLQEWTKIQTGRIQANPTQFDLSGSVRNVIALFSLTLTQKEISIHTNCPGETIVVADKNMIHTVLRNLISNAIKFTNPGGNIFISVVVNPDELFISVKDDGIGIKSETLERLFHQEVIHSTPGTQNETGSGFGLLLCQEFIEIQGGRIWAESEAGMGSAFYFTIPLLHTLYPI